MIGGLHTGAWAEVWMGGVRRDPVGLARNLAAAIASFDLTELAAKSEPGAFLPSLAASVDAAAYWQPPDGVDRALGDPLIASLLAPVAAAVATAPASQWWASAVAIDAQHEVVFDWMGWTSATSRSLRAPAGLRILEIDTPADWGNLTGA